MTEDSIGVSAKVIADSTHDGSRLTTFEATMPRFVLAEFNTHRDKSRNSASSRAIPVWKRLTQILSDPFVPLQFGKNKAGMQSAEIAVSSDNEAARRNWLIGRDIAVIQAYFLAGGEVQILKDSKENPKAIEACQIISDLSREYKGISKMFQTLSAGVHKQHANRVLEPYAWHTIITTASFWRNFYALRASVMAQPEIQDFAIALINAHMESVPQELEHDEWHLPYIFEEDRLEIEKPRQLARISSARCARVSYLTHDGKRSLDADFGMADDLQGHGHMSPFEHQARPHDPTGSYHGNYSGNFSSKWIQHRKLLEGEHDFSQFISRESLLEGMKGDERLVDFVLSLPE